MLFLRIQNIDLVLFQKNRIRDKRHNAIKRVADEIKQRQNDRLIEDLIEQIHPGELARNGKCPLPRHLPQKKHGMPGDDDRRASADACMKNEKPARIIPAGSFAERKNLETGFGRDCF